MPGQLELQLGRCGTSHSNSFWLQQFSPGESSLGKAGGGKTSLARKVVECTCQSSLQSCMLAYTNM